VLSPATPDRIVSLLGEIAPVVMTGFGPAHKDRQFADLRYRNRRKADSVHFATPAWAA
jgi:hypothetical protein